MRTKEWRKWFSATLSVPISKPSEDHWKWTSAQLSFSWQLSRPNDLIVSSVGSSLLDHSTVSWRTWSESLWLDYPQTWLGKINTQLMSQSEHYVPPAWVDKWDLKETPLPKQPLSRKLTIEGSQSKVCQRLGTKSSLVEEKSFSSQPHLWQPQAHPLHNHKGLLRSWSHESDDGFMLLDHI